MKTGQAAYDSGMRGDREKPPGLRPKSKDAGKTPIKRISIERANTGHIVEVERHSPKQKPDKDGKMMPPYDFESLRERHAHADKESAMAHVGSLMDQMGEGPIEHGLGAAKEIRGG